MDRFDRYSIYLMSWGRGSAPASPVCPPDPAFADAALASGIGVYQHAHGAPLLSIDGFDRCVAVLCEEEREDAPDVGPSAHDDIRLTDRDEREKAESRARLQGLILAGGQTDTGGRWLFDAAADEIVRLRAELQRAGAERDALGMGLSAIRATLETPAGETTQGAAGRVMREQAALMAELQQAKEALEQARAKVDDLRGVVSVQNRALSAKDEEAAGARLGQRFAREQGAAEMRDGAAAHCSAAANRKRARGKLDEADALWHMHHEIRGLPLDGATPHHPLDMDAADRRRGATVKALEAIGVEFGRAVQAARIAEEEGGSTPEAAHIACLRLANGDGSHGFYNENEYAADTLRYRIRNMLGTAASGLTEDERAYLLRLGYVEHAGTWKHMWAGPAYDTAKPEDLTELRRELAEHRELDKTELSAEDAKTLRGAGWRMDGNAWRHGPSESAWEINPTNIESLRRMAAEIRAETIREKAPAVAHEQPGKATGEEAATAGPSSLAEERGAAQGVLPVTWIQNPSAKVCGCPGSYAPSPNQAVMICKVCDGWRPVVAGAALGTSPAPGQDAAPHGGDRGQALPKPARVEVGQRWRFEVPIVDPVDLVIEGVQRGDSETRVSVRSTSGRIWFDLQQDWLLNGGAWSFLGGPSPKDPSPKRDGEAEKEHQCGGPREACMEPGCDECGMPAEMRPASDIAREMVEARSEGDTFWLGDRKESIVLSHRFSDMSQGVDCVRRIVTRFIDRGRAEGLRAACRGPAAPPAPVDTSEPTARDAVAGMLLRCGWYNVASDLASDVGSPEIAAKRIRGGHGELDAADRACLSALEVLAMGEMRVFVSRWTDGAAILDSFEARDTATRAALCARDDEATQDAAERVVAERDRERYDRLSAADTLMEVALILEIEAGQRPADVARARMRALIDARRLATRHARALDEARAEAVALREEVERWTGRAADLEKQRDEACKDALDAMREARALREQVADEPAAEPSGMRIEKRADGEWLVGSPEILSDCGEVRDERPCHYHLSGQHISTSISRTDKDGAELIMARWPIVSPVHLVEPESGGTSHPEALTSADGRVTLIIRDGVEARDVAAACIELLDLSEAALRSLFERNAYRQGIREGKHRAKVKATELLTSWEASRMHTLRLRDATSERGSDTWARRDSSALIRHSCMLELSDAFDVPLPATPTDPGKPTAEERAAGPLTSNVFTITSMLTAEEAAVAKATGWTPIVAWVAGDFTALLEESENDMRFLRGLARLDAPEHPAGCKHTHHVMASSGWACFTPRPGGEVEREAQRDRARGARRDRGMVGAAERGPKASAVSHGDVTVTAPDTMSLGDVWAALTSLPAFRVCLEAELRAARESARGTSPADLEAARRDIRAAVLDDAFRAGVEEGQRRARTPQASKVADAALDVVTDYVDVSDEKMPKLRRDIERRLRDALASAPAPRLSPVTPGPLDALAEKIENIMGDAYGRATWARHVVVRVLAIVDEHLQGAASTPEQRREVPAQGPTLDALRELVRALPKCWAPGCGKPATTYYPPHDDTTCDACDTGYRADGLAVDIGYAAPLRKLVAGIEPPPCPPSTPSDPQGTPGPGAQDGSAGDHAERVASAGRLLRVAGWTNTAMRLESGALTPQGALDVLRDGSMEEPDADDMAAIAALEALAHAEPEQPVKPSHNAEQGALAEALDRAKAVLHEAATHTATNTAEIEAERFAREIDAKQAIDGPALVAPVVVAEGERGRRSATLANAFALPDEGAADRWSAAALNRPDAPSPLPSTPSRAPAAVTPPRLEVHGETWLVGDADPGCGIESGPRGPERSVSLVCTAHLDGEHLATVGRCPGDPGRLVVHRWPIAPASPETCAACGGSGEVNAMDYTGNTEPCDACEPAEAPDPRWEPGATWEHNGERRTLMESQRQHDPPRAYFRELGWLEGHRRADMTEVNGWRYVGKE